MSYGDRVWDCRDATRPEVAAATAKLVELSLPKGAALVRRFGGRSVEWVAFHDWHRRCSVLGLRGQGKLNRLGDNI